MEIINLSGIKVYIGEVNNYKYMHIQKDNTKISYINFFVKIGARHEDINLSGVAHFLEHMIFKTTKKYTTSRIAYEIEKLGAIANASTSYETTKYYVTVLEHNFDKAFEILSDIFQNGKFLGKEIEIERNNILEELKMYLDDPQSYVSLISQENNYHNTQLGKNIIGNEKTLNKIQRQNLIDFKTKNYTFDTILIVTAGNFDNNKTKENIKKYLNKITSHGQPNEIQAKFGPFKEINYEIKNEINQLHGIISFEADGYLNSDFRYKGLILSTILGQGLGSILFKLLREKLGVAYYVETVLYQYKDTGDFDIVFGTNIDKAETTLNKIFKVLEKLKKKKISPETLERAQNLAFSSISMGYENIKYIANTCAFDWFLINQISDISDIYKKIYSITTNDILEISQKIFNQKFSINYIANREIKI